MSGKVSVSNRLQNGHWKSLQTATVTGAFACPIKGLPSIFTFLISTATAPLGVGAPPTGPVFGREPFQTTAPPIRSPATTTAMGKNLLFVSLVSICETYYHTITKTSHLTSSTLTSCLRAARLPYGTLIQYRQSVH